MAPTRSATVQDAFFSCAASPYGVELTLPRGAPEPTRAPVLSCAAVSGAKFWSEWSSL